ncbi:sodium:solute symporter family protein [Candidatus Trichorickettsia mobilis]|nr:sodium:solute symporter family protein [Candidatus Trichorickettsia mobilis]
MGGSFFYTTVSEVYSRGIYFVIALLFDAFTFVIIGYYFAPRLSEFIGKMSIADAMTSVYGEKVGFVTAIAGLIGISGSIAVQLKLSGLMFNYALGMPEIYGVIISGLVITIYSALGGIRSVTFTDIIQFFTFGTIVPLISFYLYYSFVNVDVIVDTISQSPLFDIKQLFDFSEASNKKLFIIIVFMIPAFNPAMFQRIAMAKNWQQVRSSFYTSAFFITCLALLISWIAIILFVKYPDLKSNEVVKHLIFNEHLPQGFKGLLLISIMAMIMSTADSYINSSAVLVVHDFLKNMKIKDQLAATRLTSYFIGIFAIIVSLKQGTLLDIFMFTTSFYMPTVSVPFIMACLGLRSTEKPVLWGMGAGLFVVLVWNYYEIQSDSIVPAMFANLVTLVFMHYYYLAKRRTNELSKGER